MIPVINFLEISPRLGTAGQPEPDVFEAVKEAGYEVVINLVPPSSPEWLAEEDSLVAGQGMEYIHIPVQWQEPTRQDLALFFDALHRNRARKVFAHCVMNFRVSTFVLLYRVLVEQTPIEEARRAMDEVWQPNEVWQCFMDDILKPSSGNANMDKDGLL